MIGFAPDPLEVVTEKRVGAKLGSVMDLEDGPLCSIFRFCQSAEEGFHEQSYIPTEIQFFNKQF